MLCALVLDDSRAMRSIIARSLKDWGYQVIEAGTVDQALGLLHETGTVDLAFVDWNLPGPSGFQFVAQVRADRRYDRLRIIMVTTEVGHEQVEAALKAGAQDYLMKPFTKDSLREKIELQCLGNS